ncbi:MAG: redoxin domain-containing protein [Acidimicrobiales bacterium]
MNHGGSTLATLVLADPTGAPVELTDLAGPLLVVQLVRYFGCLPCQEWLVSLDAAAEEMQTLGAQPLAVGGSADYQARYLQETRGVSMPLLLDPAQHFRDAVGVGDLGVRLLDPRGLVSYGRSLAHGFRPQRVTRDTARAPGVVILDQQLSVRWRYEGRRIGDYPPLPAVIDALTRLSGNPGPR